MTSEELLTRVKADLGLTGNDFHDATLTGYITEVKLFLADAGVPNTVVESEYAAGVISRGVSDLWNYGSGAAELSPYFMMRAAQLKYQEE